MKRKVITFKALELIACCFVVFFFLKTAVNQIVSSGIRDINVLYEDGPTNDIWTSGIIIGIAFSILYYVVYKLIHGLLGLLPFWKERKGVEPA